MVAYYFVFTFSYFLHCFYFSLSSFFSFLFIPLSLFLFFSLYTFFLIGSLVNKVPFEEMHETFRHRDILILRLKKKAYDPLAIKPENEPQQEEADTDVAS